MSEDSLPTLTITLSSREDGLYALELAFTRDSTAADPSPQRGTAAFHPVDFLQASSDPRQYGRLLAQALFSRPNLHDYFIVSLGIAQSQAQPYRICLRIENNAPELHNLRWETLCHPQSGAFLASDANLRWSREIFSQSWNEIVLRQRGDLRALVAVANPAELKKGLKLQGQPLAEVDVAGELERARGALQGIAQVDTLSSLPDGPWQVTLANLVSGLRQGYDILYLVCHGALLLDDPENPASPQKPFLLLELPDGRKDLLPGESLVAQVAALDSRITPRLVVLTACQSGGQGQALSPETARSADRGALAALGPRLAEAGVPAVVAMQSNVMVKTIDLFMPVFFEELVKDGRLERAIALARGAALAANREDWWVPTLYTRLKDGQLFLPSQTSAWEVFTPLPFEPETVLIPGGPFGMGRPAGPGVPAYETRQEQVSLPAFRMGKYPVTNAEFLKFLRQTRRSVDPELGWEGQNPPRGQEDYPVRGVTWFEALEYCAWLSQQTGRKYCLPSEAQWEKAARGKAGALYPWGDDWQPGRSNQGGSQTASVTSSPAQNDFGLCDLVGNVLQWTTTLWGEKPLDPDPAYLLPWQDQDGRDDLNANKQVRRVLRGSTYADSPQLCTCTARRSFLPDSRGQPRKRPGFRVLMTP